MLQEEEEVTRAFPDPSSPPTQWWPGHSPTPSWACQGAYTRKCLTQAGYSGVGGGLSHLHLDGVDHAEDLGLGVSIGTQRRSGPGGSAGPVGSSLRVESQTELKVCCFISLSLLQFHFNYYYLLSPFSR